MSEIREKVKPILEKLYWQGRRNADIPIDGISVNPELDEILAHIADHLPEMSEEEIYELNEADTEQRRHLFWESGVLDTCKAVLSAYRAKIQKELKG